MTCEQFRQILPEISELVPSSEQDEHLQSCDECSSLFSDLNFLTREAAFLQVDEEPSPRVWNSIEIVLREERLIREPKPAPAPAVSFWNWRPARVLLSAAAVVALAFGVALHQRNTAQRQVAVSNTPDPGPAIVTAPKRLAAALPVAPEDQQLLDAVGSRSPAMRAAYEANLEDVNAYIRDAEASAQQDPNDEDAQQYLMDAYQQRSVVYEMALDRSLP